MSYFYKIIKSIEKKVVGMTMLKLLALIGIVGIIITITINYWPDISNKIAQLTRPEPCQSAQSGCGNSSS